MLVIGLSFPPFLLGHFVALEIFGQMLPVENISQGYPLLYGFLVEVSKVQSWAPYWDIRYIVLLRDLL